MRQQSNQDQDQQEDDQYDQNDSITEENPQTRTNIVADRMMTSQGLYGNNSIIHNVGPNNPMLMSNNSQMYHHINPNLHNNKPLSNPMLQTINSNANSTQFYPAQGMNTAYFNNGSIINNQVFPVRPYINNQDSFLTTFHNPTTLRQTAAAQSYVIPSGTRHISQYRTLQPISPINLHTVNHSPSTIHHNNQSSLFIPKALGPHNGLIITIPPTVKGARFYPFKQTLKSSFHNVKKQKLMQQNKRSYLQQQQSYNQNQDSQILKQNIKKSSQISSNQISRSNGGLLQISSRQRLLNKNKKNMNDLQLQDLEIDQPQNEQQNIMEQKFQKQDMNIFIKSLNYEQNKNNDFKGKHIRQTDYISKPNNNRRQHQQEQQFYSQPPAQTQYYRTNKSDMFNQKNNNSSGISSNQFNYQKYDNLRNFSQINTNDRNNINIMRKINKSHQFQRNKYQNQQYQDNIDQMIDFKYYTINQQMELDEEIAEDLKKFILAN